MTTAVPIIQEKPATGPAKDNFRRGPSASGGPKHKNQVEYEKKMSELDGRISYLKARLDELKGGYGGSSHEGGAETPRGKLIGELKKLREESRPLQDERRAWAKEAAELRETIKKRGGELKEAKDKLPFKSIPEIDARIAEYEHQLETGSFRLAEEKMIVTEISKLNKAKKALMALEAPSNGAKSNDVGSMKLRADSLFEKIRARDVELDSFRTKIDALSAKLDEMNGARASERLSKEERNQQFEKIRKELDETYEARRKAYEENKAQRAAAFEARLKREARQKEEARCAEIEERIADLEERLAAHNPESLLDKKLAECNNMIAFFKSSSGLAEDSKDASSSTESKLAAPVARTVEVTEEISALEVVKKSDDDVFFMGGAGKSKKKAPKTNAAAPSNSLGKLPMHVLAGLADLNLAIPSTTDQVPILLEALEKVKTAIIEKKAEMEAAGVEQAIDPKMKALMDQIEALKLELAKKPEQSDKEESK